MKLLNIYYIGNVMNIKKYNVDKKKSFIFFFLLLIYI